MEEIDRSSSGRLAETYSPCFSLILKLRSSSTFPDPEVLRQNLTQVLNECERVARQESGAQNVEDAKFAIIAFIDETLLSSDWDLKGSWMANPLQLEIYNRFDAGEHFFERMNVILTDPSRLVALVVYYLCLALGFKGKYQLVEQDRLRSLIEAARSELKTAPQMKAGPLAPHGEPDDQLKGEIKSKLPPWAMIAIVVVIGVLVYTAMSLILSQKAGNTVDAIDALTSVDVPVFPDSQRVTAIKLMSNYA